MLGIYLLLVAFLPKEAVFMSWRFRKTFKVMPGVKLNLTRHGLSATVGASPLSVNLGPRGIYANMGIPGTGLWNRERLDVPSGRQPPTVQPHIPVQLPSPSLVPDATGGIRSASTESLNSENLDALRHLLKHAHEEYTALEKEIALASWEGKRAIKRYESWNRGFLFKRLFKAGFVTRKDNRDTAIAKMEELQEQLRLTRIATEITIDKEQSEPYYRMRDDFAALCQSHTIWNLLTERAIDRVKQRSVSNIEVDRTPVQFQLGSCDIIQWEQQIPHLANRTGGDMFIYPGFVLYRESKQAFALIEFHDVDLKYVTIRFTERDAIPADSHIVGQTWQYANKDGSPDRRFNNNHQMPIAQYAELLFTSRDGLDVRYMLSNPALAERFVQGWSAFRKSLSLDAPTITAGDPLFAAFLQFKPHILAFMEMLSKSVKENAGTGKATLPEEAFEAQMVATTTFIVAAREAMTQMNLPRTKKTKVTKCVNTIETAQKALQQAVDQGAVNSEHVTAYTNAVASFTEAAS